MKIHELCWSYFRARPWLVAMYVIFSMYYPLRILLIPFMAGKLTGEITGGMSMSVIKRLGVYISLLWVGALAMRMVLGVVDNRVSVDFQQFVRTRILHHVIETNRRNFQDLETGELLVKLFAIPETCYRAVRLVRINLLPTALVIACGVVIFGVLSRPIMLIYSGFVVALGVLSAVMARTLTRKTVCAMDGRDRLYEGIDETLGNMLWVYVNDAAEDEEARIDESARVAGRQELHVGTLQMTFYSLATVLKMGFMTAMLVAVGVMRARLLPVVAPIVFMIMSMDTVLYNAALDLMDFLGEVCRVRKTQAFLDRVDRAAVPVPPRNRLVKRVEDGRVEMRGVRVLRGDVAVIEDMSFTVPARARVLITGVIGSGKTTLVSVLVGLLPYQGSTTLDGHEVRDMSTAELSRAITFVPQTARLFNRTIEDNIAAGLPNVTRADIVAVLARLRLDSFPPLTQLAGKGGARLSGGQRTMVFLLRAFFRRAPIVVLDEPTAALDTRTRDTVVRAVRELFADRTVLVITHDESAAWNPTMRLRVRRPAGYEVK
jgi:ABC-type multidrug transport system fused ATPase/permease subunit